MVSDHRVIVKLTLRAPAKLNLSLAVVGREADGFHRLVSCVVPLALADTLEFSLGGVADTMDCDDASIPVDGSNLVLRAAAVFRAAYPSAPHGHFSLSKKVPHGAGLGGGSSDAASALRLLNMASGHPFDDVRLQELATSVGSDCAFFVDPVPTVMRQRGQLLQRLSGSQAVAYHGRHVLLIKPAFGVSTVNAYGWFVANGSYTKESDAEAALTAALSNPDAVVKLGNSLQAPVFARHPELAQGLAVLKSTLGISAVMTGSGSACFALVDGLVDLARVRAALEPAWGPNVWATATTLA
jgi:4-diphosphocytidyl-2-C-methyl-D-erythritol kinase